MGIVGQLALGARLARRGLRGGMRSLRIVLACLALGVAAIAAVGTLRAGIQAGLLADGARILGGDVEVRGGARPLPAELRQWAAARAPTSPPSPPCGPCWSRRAASGCWWS
ncbi:hypothetical protein ACFQY5_09225 [Paeniroseomonas aquatica]|uniref:hypothetical protein n=1 Tax=Paeniroseomonas aquatica TaxID=373043 RepID=UPI0036178A10